MCEIAVEVGMKWVKTSTGWAPTGATVEKVSIIADQLKGRIDIKGAGAFAIWPRCVRCTSLACAALA